MVPAWLASREPYEPKPGRSGFSRKSALSILAVLAALRERPGTGRSRERALPELKLISTILLVLLVSLSRSWLFLEAAVAAELVLLGSLKAELILRVLRKVLAAGLFALVVFAPAALLGRGQGVPALCAKVILSVLAAAIFSATTGWPSIAAAFAGFRAPGIFVMTLDMAVKYIALLGGLLLELLTALKLRSVGRDEHESSSLAAVAGTLFLKSTEAAGAQAEAMACRCFVGKYRTTRPRTARRLVPIDASLVAADLALVAAFVLFGAPR